MTMKTQMVTAPHLVEQSNRQTWIDIAKGIAIICVVIGHATLDNTLYYFIYTFHMPFFFIMSGYLLDVPKWEIRLKEFFIGRCKRLLRPYFIAAILSALFVMSVSLFFLHNNLFLSLRPLVGVFYACGIDDWLFLVPLWFLPCLFVAEIIYITAAKGKQGRPTLGLFIYSLLTAALGYIIGHFYALPWSLDVAMIAQLYLFTGHWLRYTRILGKINAIHFAFLMLTFILILKHIGRINMDLRLFGHVPLFYLGGIIGFLLLVSIAKTVDRTRTKKFFSYCGKQSMFILVAHPVIQTFLTGIYISHNPEATGEGVRHYTDYSIIASFVGVFGAVAVCKYLGKYALLKEFKV